MSLLYPYKHWGRLLSVLLVLLLGVARPGHAQLYYLTTDGAATSQTANDALNRLNTADNSTSTVVSAIANSPTLLALDPVGNRAFVYEALTASRGIKVYSLNSPVTLLYTLPVPAQVSAIEYDAVSDYVYFLTTDGSAATLSATDALNRIKANNTGTNEVLVSSVANAPTYLALNAAGNRAYVSEGLTASRGIKTINLATNLFVGATIPVPAQLTALAYARSNGNLYFLTTDGDNTAPSANDALYQVQPNDSNTPPTPTAVITNLTNSPAYLALDLANNRIYVADNYASSRGFRIINTTTNAVTTVSQSVQFTAIEISQQAAPTVTTTTPASITSNRAVLGGNVTTDGGATVTERGVVYSTTNTTPTTADTKAANGSGTGSFSATVTGLTASTTYYVRAYATNSTGTSYGAAISFVTAAPVSGTTVVTNVSCFGGSNGTINLTPTGGLAPYTFLWNNGSTTEDRTGLSAGSYSVTITDAAGATGTVSNIIVTQPSALTAATSQTNIACNGSSTGAASVSPSGGTPSYTYRWSTGATTQAITGLAAGSYSVTVTDANGCTLTRNFTITQPSALTATTSQTNVTTNGGNNGSATITVSGGTPSYTYSWSPNVSTTATASNLSAGTYTVTATDANGCTIVRSFTITQPTVVTVTSVTRLMPSPTATTQVSYRVVLSGNVTGLTVSNFTPTITSGTISGASIASVAGSGTTYTVTVNTGSYNGTLRLDVANSTGTTPTITNVPYTAGEQYTITKSFAAAPTLRIQGAGSVSGNSDVTAFVDAVQVLQSGTSTVVANGVQNGSFETNNVSPGSYLYQADGVVAQPWSFGVQAGISRNNSAFGSTAASGDAVTFLQSTASNNGSVSQNLAVPTGSYQVSFQAIQRNYTSLDQQLNVFVNDVFVGNIQPNNIPTYDTFTSATFSVTAPALTATVSTTSASPTSTAPIPFAVSFSQSVGTSFTASDVTVAGGTLNTASFSGSGSGPYTFTVTPNGTGIVTVSLAAGVASDANNTPNSASNRLSLQFVAPTITVGPAALPQGTRGTAYSQTLSAAGGTAPYTFAITAGALPVGLSLTPAGVLAGTPAVSGSFTFTVTTTDNSSAPGPYNGSRSYTLTIAGPTITLAPTTLPTGTVAAAYSQTIAASGGTAPYTYALTAGALPAGLTLTSAGVLAGTPTAGGTFNFTVTAFDASTSASGGPYTGSRSYTLTVAVPTIAVAPATLPNGQQGVAYSQTLTASGGTAPYTYAITAGALPSGLSLSSSGTIAGTPTANGTFSFTVTATDASTGSGPYSGSRSYSLPIAAPTVTSVTWNGNNTTDWFTASNWTPNQVPDATIDVVIPTSPSGGRFPIIVANAAPANARNVSIASGASLSMSGNTLTLAANLTNNGTFQPGGGTVVLGTSALSSILGAGNTRFWNLTVGSNGAQQSTSASTSVQRVLTLNGNFAINGNPFTLLSSASGDALVVNNGGVVTGTATVQRYLDPSLNPGLGYRHYSAPVGNTTVADLATSGFSPVLNPTYNTSATPSTERPFPTVYGYDQSRVSLTNTSTPFDRGFFSPATLGDALTGGQGYAVNLSATQLVDFNGTLNTGTFTQSLASNRDANPDGGWQLVGNPYPAPLDYSQVATADRLNLEGAGYVYSSTGQYTGQYRVFNNGVGGNAVIPSGQGFFVRVAAGQPSGTLTFRNSQRLTTPDATTVQRTAETRPLVQLTLKGASGTASDNAYVYFEQGATMGFDAQYDAVKLPNTTGLNVSASLGSQQFAINGQPVLGTTQRIVPLALGVPTAGTYTFTAAQVLNLSTVPVYLRDLQSGAVIDLAKQPSYSFTVSNASALITTRFELVFSPQQPLATAPAALAQQVALYPNPAKQAAFVELPASLGRQAVTATLVDALGREARTVTLPAQGALAHQLDLTDIPSGVYALRLSTSAGVLVKKLTVQ